MTLTQNTSVDLPQVNRDRRSLLGWLWRSALIVVATAAIVLELPSWARAPLAIAAALVTAAFCVRYMRRRSPLDRVLTGTGVAIVALALLGLALNVLPWGLTALGWGIGVGVVELAAVTALSFLRPPVEVTPARSLRVPPAGVIWGALTAAVLALAIVWATTSFAGTHTSPLAISGVQSGSSMTVTISSGSTESAYELVRVAGTKRTVIAPDVEVSPNSPVKVTIAVHDGVREEIELVRPGSTTVVRELILDNRPAATKASK
jgi:hypothetical protein